MCLSDKTPFENTVNKQHGSNTIYSVSKLNNHVRILLENKMGIVWLIGEISNLMVPVSGHWYFTLKDAQAQVKCAMFKGKNNLVTFKPSNGNQVLVRAKLSLYEPRGDYQLIVESMHPEGNGLLQQQFEQLKMQLMAEGLFADSNKKPLPENAKRIGIITSQTGAALHDILHILKRRNPSLPVVIYPTQVQGKEAAFLIAQAIGRANIRQECDVLILGRGGGSLEDLWCFNEEIVARTIAASHIPIISAVGHEIDVTIADFVADVRAPTPSAAAELVSRDTSFRFQQLAQRQQQLTHQIKRLISINCTTLVQKEHILTTYHPKSRLMQQIQQIDSLERRLNQALHYRLNRKDTQLKHLFEKFIHLSPLQKITPHKKELNYLTERLIDNLGLQLRTHQHQLALKMEKLDAVSPLATLARGYSVTLLENGKPLRSVQHVKSGDEIITLLSDGQLRSKIN